MFRNHTVTPPLNRVVVTVALTILATALPTPAAGMNLQARTSSRSFAVYRMLGNDMWPLQGSGQMRRNSVFSAIHEEQAPPNVPVYWVVNRIVNATERALLVSELKAAGVKRILYVSPPLNAMHCLSSMQARVLFAQAQNSVRNAMLRHAREQGHDWAIPLDGRGVKGMRAKEEEEGWGGRKARLIALHTLRSHHDAVQLCFCHLPASPPPPILTNALASPHDR